MNSGQKANLSHLRRQVQVHQTRTKLLGSFKHLIVRHPNVIAGHTIDNLWITLGKEGNTFL